HPTHRGLRTGPRRTDRRVGSGAGARPPGERTAASRSEKGGLAPWEKWEVIRESRQEDDLLSGLPVEVACALLEVNRGSYYRRPGDTGPLAPLDWAGRDVALRDAIERVVLEFPGYGYRRVSAHLRRDGWKVNRKRVL